MSQRPTAAADRLGGIFCALAPECPRIFFTGHRDARRDGHIDGTEPIQEQLTKAGLVNKNRGRDPARWEVVDPQDVIEEVCATFDIRTPKKASE